jgi:choline/glycine/proline betaine transport protein
MSKTAGNGKWCPPVFISGAVLIILFAFVAIIFKETFANTVNHLNQMMSHYFSWWFMLVVAFYLVFIIWLFFSPYSKTKLGPDDSKPDYSFWSWVAMHFSAGMGIGLVFFGVAEPIYHYMSPPNATPETIDAARLALHITFFHWGFPAWATYDIIGLSIAYFSFRKRLPVSIRSCFYPILGNKIYRWPGHLIDILAILGCLFGLATSLGLGVLQINSGLKYLIDLPMNVNYQLVMIALITCAAVTSIIMGLDKGIKNLSVFNMIMVGILFLFVFFGGPTLQILNLGIQATGYHLQHFVGRLFWTDAFNPDHQWLSSWTVFYWAWWIAWSPFVGMFIARVSRGRTIREFIASVLVLPSGFGFIWFSVFGGSALLMERSGNVNIAATVQSTGVEAALFEFLKGFPLSSVVSVIAVIVIITFFVTSSDSGSFVVDMLASGGAKNPPLLSKIWWGCLEGVVAGILLKYGGKDSLNALKTGSVITGLPFSIVLVFMCYSLYKALKAEHSSESHP